MRLAIAVCLLLTSSALARDIYVDNVGGDDQQDGGAPGWHTQGSGPCRTIARALRLAQKGDRIILANTGQPYRECITLQAGRHSGIETQPFTILGNGATLDGSFPVSEDAWEHVRGDVFRFQPPRMSYQQLFLNDRPLTRRSVTTQGALPELQPMEWYLFQRALYFRVEPGRLPQQYGLTFAGHPVGITLYEVRHVIIDGLTVQGFQLDGINAHDGVYTTTIQSVVCRGNARSGISIGGASRVRLENCLIGDNGAAQVRTEGYSKTWIVDCDLLDNTAPSVVRQGGDVFVESDPELSAKPVRPL